MKEYRSYMDNVSVDRVLHEKIMNRLRSRSRPKRAVSSRLVATLACAMLALMIVWALPHLLGLELINFMNSGASRQGGAPPSTGAPSEALFFNRAEQAPSAAAKKYIPGYFTKELAPEEMPKLFGGTWLTINQKYAVSAVAGFSGQGNLDEVAITCQNKVTGHLIKIQMAKGLVPVDFLYPGDPKPSDINGTLVTAGYWSDSSDGRDTLYYASFLLGETGYYIELSGKEEAKQELTELVNLIVTGGPVDLSQIKPDSISKGSEDELTAGLLG